MTIAETNLNKDQQSGFAELRNLLRSRKSRVFYEHVVIYAVGRLKFVRFEDSDARPLLLYVWANKQWMLTPEYN